jgi:hypothetical protein
MHAVRWGVVPSTVLRTATTIKQALRARSLAKLAERGAACVVVEDALGVKRDPNAGMSGSLLTGFVGEKVDPLGRREPFHKACRTKAIRNPSQFFGSGRLPADLTAQKKQCATWHPAPLSGLC